MPAIGSLVDVTGAVISLGSQIGSGGEGAVYELKGDHSTVVKIYHAPPPPEKVAKLQALTASASTALASVAAWPTRIVLTQRAKVLAGIVMPRVVQHHEIHKLYSPAHRKVTFPTADWSFLIGAARNCAAAFNVIHGSGHVVGDVNQGGILISPRATVQLIDCDSFQLKHAGRIYPCDVGVSHFTPPELQGRNFKGLHRTEDHDRFGLAILIFHLLFMGRHPFVGRFLGKGDMRIEDAIVQGRFAFSQNASRMQMMAPPFALRLLDASIEVADMFERAFQMPSAGGTRRPTAAEWGIALDILGHQLTRCARYPAHTFHKSLTKCPWCQIEQAGGPDLFIALTAATKLGGSFDLNRLWSAVSSAHLPATPTIAVMATTPSTGVPAPQLRWANWTAAFGLLFFTLLISSMWFPQAMPPALAFGLIWLAAKVWSPHSREKRTRRLVLAEARARVTRVEKEIRNATQEAKRAFDDVRATMEQGKAEYVQLPSQFAKEEQELRSRQRELQLKAYLRLHFIEKGKIQGFGPARLATLRSYGIETASDVNRGVQVPGIGPALLNALMAWRLSVEGTFRFEPTKAIDPRDLDFLRHAHSVRRRALETRLETGASELTALAAKTRNRYGALHGESQSAVRALAIADAAVRGIPNRLGLA